MVDPAAIDPALWETPAPLHGIDLGLERQLQLIETQLAPMIAELEIPIAADAGSSLYLENPWYGPMDAHSLYAMLRLVRPGSVLELGSGFSSLVIERALEDNAAGGARAVHEVVDPFPSPLLAHARTPVAVRTESAAETEPEAFSRLADGDVLFVDTTHVVRPGGEVVRVVLEVLPTLASGVRVHFHDIFTPFPYPRLLYERYHAHWQEQYLVQAFLAYNPGFSVELSNHALWRLHRERVQPRFPGLRPGIEPSALWIVKR